MKVFFKLGAEVFSKAWEDALNVIQVFFPLRKDHKAIEASLMGSEFILGVLAALDLYGPSGLITEVKLCRA